jgi:hypothetical protein
VTYSQIISGKLEKAGWVCGCIVSMDSEGETFSWWLRTADGRRVIVRADELLSAYVEAERAIKALTNP